MRILIIDTNQMIYDGIFSAIMNYSQRIAGKEFQFDFVAINEVEPEIREKIAGLHAHLYVLRERNSNPAAYILHLAQLIRRNRYELVHAHGSSCTLAVEMTASALAGVPCCPHSHSTNCQHRKAHALLRPLFCLLYRHGFACTEEAGRWLYGNRTFDVIKNGIDAGRYKFDEMARDEYRRRYGIGEYDTALVHIAFFSPVKNHKFLIGVFQKVIEKDRNYKLLLVGQGELENDVRELVRAKHLDEYVTFVGVTEDIPQILSASDALVLPSLYEGFGFVNIEAQASGLPCYVSDRVPPDCRVTELVRFLPLDQKVWTQNILGAARNIGREESSRSARVRIVSAGFDIKDNVRRLKGLYMRYGKKVTAITGGNVL